jgi:Helix-turn-helix
MPERMQFVMAATLPWSHTKPQRPTHRRRGQLDHAAVFFDGNGNRTFGFSCEMLRALVHDTGTTYTELAAASGVSRVVDIARGYRQPHERQVVAMARALNVEPWQLCWT